MNNNELAFIELISCFLNSKKPSNSPDSWKEIFNLAKINDVAGVIGHEILLLPADKRPIGQIKSLFNQYLGATVQEYDKNQQALADVLSFLQSSGFDYLLVKGAAIRQYYPAPELRISGDVDVVVRNEQFEKLISLLKENSFDIDSLTDDTIVANVDDVKIEFHNGADVFGDYFSDNIFDICSSNGYEYTLDIYHQLLYVVLHMVKHLNHLGAGIRMLMDIDVCVRSVDDFDQEKFLSLCSDAGIEQCSRVILSLCNYWFSTPLRCYIDLSENDDLVELLANSFLHGGTFGSYGNSLGNLYLSRNVDSESISFWDRIKTIIKWIFPPVSSIRGNYRYASKHRILIPFGYLNRLYDGIIKRGTHSLNTVKQISLANSSALITQQILKELNISDK